MFDRREVLERGDEFEFDKETLWTHTQLWTWSVPFDLERDRKADMPKEVTSEIVNETWDQWEQ